MKQKILFIWASQVKVLPVSYTHLDVYKRQVTAAQKRYLQDLIKYHRIELNVEIDSLTKNEASREIDKILSTYGKIMR